jgi:hypothetical protein
LEDGEKVQVHQRLHVELLGTIPRPAEIAEKGLEDHLDPWCVSMFDRRMKRPSWRISKGEIKDHVSKGKWGRPASWEDFVVV